MNVLRFLWAQMLVISVGAVLVVWAAGLYSVATNIDATIFSRSDAPEFLGIVRVVTGLFLGTYVLCALVVFVMPASLAARRVLRGAKWLKVRRNSDLGKLVSEVAISLNTPEPTIRVVAGLEAWMIAGFGGSFLVLGQALISSLDREALKWVIAHEMSHRCHGDLVCGYLIRPAITWLVCLASLLSGAVRVVTVFQAGLGFAGILLTPLRLLLIGPLAAIDVMSDLFLLVDRSISRRIELRADKAASECAGTLAGLRAIDTVVPETTPGWSSIWLTHPRKRVRLQRISLGKS